MADLTITVNGEVPQPEAIKVLLALARGFKTGHVGEGRGWTRDELHRV